MAACVHERKKGGVEREIQLKGILQLLWINLRSLQLNVKVRRKSRASEPSARIKAGKSKAGNKIFVL